MPSIPREALVTGAAGFIGRRVVSELLRRGWSVRAFVHPEDSRAFSASAGASTWVGDVRDADALRRAATGTQAVISLAARKMDEPDSEATNVGGARHLVAACESAGVHRIINVSTQSAKLPRPGTYGRTKLAADEVFARSGLAVTTLRPSLVYGDDDSGVFETVRRFVDRLPVVPILGDGRWVSAPLHVDEVARAIVDCLDTAATIGRTYDLGGPDFIAFDAFIDLIAACLGRASRKMHVPLAIALPLVRTVKFVWPGAPISVSNVLGSTQDTAIDLAPARRDFGFAARPLHVGLQQVFGSAEDRVLRDEARRLAKHLLNIPLQPTLRERYVDASRMVFGVAIDGSVHFARRHPWSLPWLDGALGLFRRDAQLRHRILLMASILETSPELAERFLKPPPRKMRLIAGLFWRGVTGALKTALGTLVLPFVSKRCDVGRGSDPQLSWRAGREPGPPERTNAPR